MDTSKILIICAAVTAALTVIGVGIAAALDRTLIPIIAGVGSAASAALSHEMVKTILMKIVTYLTTPATIAAINSDSVISLELQARLNRHPYQSRTLIFSSHESGRDLNGRRTMSNIETKVEETIEGITPSSSSGGTFVTAGSNSESSNNSGKSNRSSPNTLPNILIVD